MPASPTPDLMDSLSLFSHGEFLCFDNPDPELILFSHGEFPRPGVVAGGGVGSDADAVVGTGRRRRPVCEPKTRVDDEGAIALALLVADDDDWW